MGKRRALKHILFDLDDTLVPAASVYPQAMAAVGLSEDAHDYRAARAQIKARVQPSYAASVSRFVYFKAMLDADPSLKFEQVVQWGIEYERRVARLMHAEWHRLDRTALMRRLKSALGVRLHLITNETVRMQLQKIALFDPRRELFDTVTISEEAGCSKPDPSIFELALSRIGASPEEVLIVGDRWETDLAPALELGMSACLSREFWPKDQALPEGMPASVQVVDRLVDLLSAD